jgi:hypothetical protein
MNPQVRALTETKGNGPVLRRGKNTGGARKLRHVLTIERLGHAPRFPPFQKWPDAKAGVAMMKHTLTQAWLFILITPALARAALDLG